MAQFMKTIAEPTIPSPRRECVTSAGVTHCTVAVFAHNEERTIAKTILSVIHQNLPPTIEIAEILVVASGCTDGTLEILKTLVGRYGNITVIEERRRSGKAHAVNMVLQRSIGSIIFLVPGDVIIEPDAINELCSTLGDPSIGVACGKACPVNSSERAADRIGLLLWNLHNKTQQSLSRESLSTHACGEFMALKKGVVQRIEEDIVNDDAYLGILAWSRGFRVTYNENARVLMKAPTRVSEIIRQRTRIVLGHQLVKHRLGHFPRTLTSMILYDQTRVIRVIAEQLVENPNQVFTLVLACYVEVLANLFALLARVSGVDFRNWSAIESTKDIELLSEHAEVRANVEPL